MSYLLDTNVVSEWVRRRPDPGVVRWLAGVDEGAVHLSVVTLAELRHSVERIPDGERRRRLEGWLAWDLPARFDGRVLAIDSEAADLWGRIVAHRDSTGRPIGVMDGFIAAIAEVRDLTLVTRNVSDFESSVTRLLNPWSE